MLLLDIRGLLIRNYHGGSDSEKGFWGNAFQTFLERDLNPLLDTYAPREIFAVWDAGNEYRLSIHKEYKKHRYEREKDPVEEKQLSELMNRTKLFLAHLGAKNVEVPGQEADDVISLFCEKFSSRTHILVHTVDADLLQLAGDGVNILFQNELYTSRDQLSPKGFPVGLTALYKSMVGDSTDNYSGVPKLGEKGWSELVASYGIDGMQDLEAAVRSLDRETIQYVFQETGDKQIRKLLDGWDEWTKCYQLATLNPRACYGVRGQQIVYPKWTVRVPSKTGLEQVLYSAKASDMASLYWRWLPEFTLITQANVESLASLQNELLSSPVVSYDFESYDTLKNPNFAQASKSSGGKYVDVLSQSITGMSINYGNNMEKTFYVSVNHADTDNVSRDWVVWLLQVLAAREVPPVVQNAAFEVTVSMQDLGFQRSEIRAPYDTAIMATYVDENAENNLKIMSSQYLSYRQQTYAEVVGDRDMSQVPATEVLYYGCDDSLVTSVLFDLFKTIMVLEDTWEFYKNNEVEHVVDSSFEFIHGTRIDLGLVDRFREEDTATIESCSALIREALLEHFDGTPEKALRVSELTDAWWELEKLKYTNEEEAAEKAKEKLFNDAWYASFYVPYTETVDVKFSATAAQIDRLIRTMSPDCEIKLVKVDGCGISDWLDELDYKNVIRLSRVIDDEKEHDRTDTERLVAAVMRLAIRSKTIQKNRSKNESYGGLNAKGLEETDEHKELMELATSLLTKYKMGKLTKDGSELNFGSSKQMQCFLYGMLELPIRKRSKVLKNSTRDKFNLPGSPATGNKAIAAAIVYDVKEDDWRYPVLMAYKKIVACRQSISLYYTPYPLWVHPVDEMIHPQIRNCGTVTRRPAGSSPNVLQVSKQEDAKIRNIFLPWGNEYVTVSADYSGQEVVITACESGDPVMLDVLREKKDVHSMTATGFAHTLLNRRGFKYSGKLSYDEFKQGLIDHPEIFKEIRNKAAKGAIFTAFYVGGAKTLAENILIDVDTAEEIMNGLFDTYIRLQPWQREVVDFARKHGYVQTAYGNRRHLTKDLLSDDRALSSRQERQAVNYLIQGCAADVLKIVLTDIKHRNMVEKYRMRSLKPVYDEISACVPRAAALDYIHELQEVMCVQPPGYPLRLSVDVSVGTTWGSVRELEELSESAIDKALSQQETH